MKMYMITFWKSKKPWNLFKVVTELYKNCQARKSLHGLTFQHFHWYETFYKASGGLKWACIEYKREMNLWDVHRIKSIENIWDLNKMSLRCHIYKQNCKRKSYYYHKHKRVFGHLQVSQIVLQQNPCSFLAFPLIWNH